MAFCPNCGAQLQDGTKFCPNCGNALNNSAPQSVPTQAPTYQAQPNNFQPQTNNYYAPQTQVPNYPTGGLMTWSIITLLLCTLPGIVAVVNATKINKAATVEEQQKYISSTKTWCIVGTILGILIIIGRVAAG